LPVFCEITMVASVIRPATTAREEATTLIGWDDWLCSNGGGEVA
jgi:hypothetical protein